MNLQLKRKLDTWLGFPALVILNAFARILGLVMHRNHQVGPMNRVLFMKFQGMGSLAIARPAIRKLKLQYPKSHFIFWGSPSTCTLAQQMPEFDEIVTLDESSFLSTVASLISTFWRFWRKKVDWAFDLEAYSKVSSILATLTCARNRAGFAVDSVRFRSGAHTHLIFFNRYVYLGSAYEKLVELAIEGPVSARGELPEWKFPLQPSDHLPRTPYIIVNIHAGDLAPERKWPKSYFEELINLILEADPLINIVLIGHGKSEIDESETIRPHERLLNVTGKLGLVETLKAIKFAKLTITNDSSPLHFASNLGAPVLALFGPTKAQTYFYPELKNSLALSEGMFCSPCTHHWDPPPCQGNNQCMKRMSPHFVFNKAAGLLGFDLLPDIPSQAPLYDPHYNSGLVYSRK